MNAAALLVALAVAAPAGADRPPCSPPPAKDLASPASFAGALLEKAVREKDDAAQAVAIAAVEALDTVVELRDGKPTGRLQLTAAERRALQAEILRKFGDSVRAGPSTENDFATNAASAWFRVLSDGSYRATDEP